MIKLCSIVLLGLSLSVGNAATPKKPAPKVDSKELAAAILVAEAGGEGTNGLMAVTEVINNRMKARKISLYAVITEPRAFACFYKSRSNPQGFITKWKKHPRYSYALWCINNYKGNSLTKGSLYYHEKKLKAKWSKGVKPTAKIGNHLFFATIKY